MLSRTEQNFALYLRRVFKYVLRYSDGFETTSKWAKYSGQQASDLIKDGILSNEPFAVSRFGYSELRAILTYMHIRSEKGNLSKILEFAKGNHVEPWWHPNTLRIITHNAGVFPKNLDTIEKFSTTVLKDIDQIDVLGSWLGGEAHLLNKMPNTKLIRFHDFYHFLHDDPWTNALKGKNVLVVHPFENSIKAQFQRKELIYPKPHMLPDFQLKTFRSVQSIAGNVPDKFSNWFEALEYQKESIRNINFDVAILGCGAYGMPLAVYIKNELGKKAIHLGGNTQILFGITGSRWEADPFFKGIFNQNWIRPDSTETPSKHETIDENCYW